MIKLIKVSKRKTLGLIKRYKAAQGGVAAIEFVFVAPIMLAMYFGLAEISTAISQDRKISHSTNVAGDLTTQASTITADDMAEIMTATTLIMGIPQSKLADVKIEISSYIREATGNNATLLGKASLNGTFPEAFVASNLDPLILSNSSGVVVARVSYDYEPLKLSFFDSNITLNETFLLKPRKSATVNFIDDNGLNAEFNCSLSGRTVNC